MPRTDTERLDWLATRMHSADFHYDVGEDHLGTVVMFTWPRDARIGADLRKNIDAAMQEDADERRDIPDADGGL
jgi:hypothetical protein